MKATHNETGYTGINDCHGSGGISGPTGPSGIRPTFYENLMIMFGYKYLLNKRSKEVHKLCSKHKNCGINLMSRKNKKYLTEAQKDHLFDNDIANGCRWCYSERNIENN